MYGAAVEQAAQTRFFRPEAIGLIVVSKDVLQVNAERADTGNAAKLLDPPELSEQILANLPSSRNHSLGVRLIGNEVGTRYRNGNLSSVLARPVAANEQRVGLASLRGLCGQPEPKKVRAASSRFTWAVFDGWHPDNKLIANLTAALDKHIQPDTQATFAPAQVRRLPSGKLPFLDAHELGLS